MGNTCKCQCVLQTWSIFCTFLHKTVQLFHLNNRLYFFFFIAFWLAVLPFIFYILSCCVFSCISKRTWLILIQQVLGCALWFPTYSRRHVLRLAHVYSHFGWKHPSARSRASYPARRPSHWSQLKSETDVRSMFLLMFYVLRCWRLR